MNANAYTKYAILFGQKWAIFTNIRLADVWLVASARILAMAECCCGFFCFFFCHLLATKWHQQLWQLQFTLIAKERQTSAWN